MPRIDREKFVRRLQPMIDHQVKLYRQDPQKYHRLLPVRMHGHFSENTPSKTISLGWMLAVCLITTHRAPSANYIWRMMYEDHTDAMFGRRPTWQPQEDPELVSLLV